jgi:sugar transferase (PEP-CTERM/EpsH1 system associated)
MKILFACHRFPFPPNRGGKIRPFNMIRHLSRAHEVFVASLAHTRQELDDGAGLKEYCAAIYAEVVPEKLRWFQAVKALAGSTPSSVAYFSSERLRDTVKQAARRITFDAVVVHCAFAAQYGLEIPAKFRLIDFGDLDSGKWLDYAKWRSFPLSGGYYLEGKKLRAYEKKITGIFDFCTLTTQGELEAFGKLNVLRPQAVIPNGVDGSYFRPSDETSPENPVIVLVGRMDYFPNIDGAQYFARNIFPIVRRHVPDVQLQLVGSNPTRGVRNLASIPGVTVTGHVADVRPYLAKATVSVAPLRLARGTQNKILESMAMGIPVVATAQAAKGVQASPGQHLLVADRPEPFADHVVNVIKEMPLRKALSEAGRRQVHQVHSWDRAMSILDDILHPRGGPLLAMRPYGQVRQDPSFDRP